MRKKGLPPLDERFEFLGDGMLAGERTPLSSSIFEVEERATGTPYNLKLSTKCARYNGWRPMRVLGTSSSKS